VFSLHPLCKKYSSTRENGHYLRTTATELHIGSDDIGSAIVLSQDLKKVRSHICSTFRNQPLCGGVEGEFEISWIEAFNLY
jgi:hypothetical protein